MPIVASIFGLQTGRRHFVAAGSAFAVLGVGRAMAADRRDNAQLDVAQSLLSDYGYSVTRDLAAKPARIDIVLNQQKAVEHFDELKALQMVNPSVNEDTVLQRPTIFAMTMLMEYVPVQLMALYEGNPKLDKLHVSAFNDVADLYGNLERRPMFAFDFNRALNRRINWGNFNYANLTKIAPNFSVSLAAKQSVLAEAD